MAGGLVLGTMLFGDSKIALRRIRGTYDYYLQGAVEDPMANAVNYHVKFK